MNINCVYCLQQTEQSQLHYLLQEALNESMYHGSMVEDTKEFIKKEEPSFSQNSQSNHNIDDPEMINIQNLDLDILDDLLEEKVEKTEYEVEEENDDLVIDMGNMQF